MSEKESDFQSMSPQNAKEAVIKQAEMLQKGAEITESGGLKATEEQVDFARGEMLLEKTMQTVKELVTKLEPDREVLLKLLESRFGGFSTDPKYRKDTDPKILLGQELIKFLKGIADIDFGNRKKE